jgi:REP element-mobilizing transposase RayT
MVIMSKQLDLFTNKGHGGKRTGAGRKRKDPKMQLHVKREVFDSKHPIHVNIKLVKGLPNLRTKKYFKIVKRAILVARQKGLRIIHFCVQSNHLHLLIESSGKEGLSTGMQSFCTSMAKSLNYVLDRSGAVFRDRYHPHILKTLREVKNALLYIFQNFAKHTKVKSRFDPYSSLICFLDKKKLGLGRVNTHSIFSNLKEREKFKEKMNELILPAKSF